MAVSLDEALNILVHVAFPNRQAVEFVSGPGIGKSDLITKEYPKALEAQYGLPFTAVTLECSAIEPADGMGFAIPTKIRNPNGVEEIVMSYARPDWWPTDALTKDHGVVIFLDEWGKTPPDVKKVFAPMILERRIGPRMLPENTHVVLASNRAQDKSGEYDNPAHIENRRMKLDIRPDFKGWQRWAFRHGVHPLTIAFAERHISEVFRDSVPSEIGPFCTPRSLVKMDEALQTWTRHSTGKAEGPLEKLTSDALAMHMSAGWVGVAVSTGYHAFIRVADELPSLEEIKSKPKTCKLPEKSRPDAVLVICNQLASTIDEKNSESYLTYVSRMPKEFQVSTATKFFERDPSVVKAIFTSSQFADWAHKNADIIQAATQAT